MLFGTPNKEPSHRALSGSSGCTALSPCAPLVGGGGVGCKAGMLVVLPTAQWMSDASMAEGSV